MLREEKKDSSKEPVKLAPGDPPLVKVRGDLFDDPKSCSRTPDSDENDSTNTTTVVQEDGVAEEECDGENDDSQTTTIFEMVIPESKDFEEDSSDTTVSLEVESLNNLASTSKDIGPSVLILKSITSTLPNNRRSIKKNRDLLNSVDKHFGCVPPRKPCSINLGKPLRLGIIDNPPSQSQAKSTSEQRKKQGNSYVLPECIMDDDSGDDLITSRKGKAAQPWKKVTNKTQVLGGLQKNCKAPSIATNGDVKVNHCKKVFRCEFCYKYFPTAFTLANHKESDHGSLCLYF